ncbi:hypothetical protein [Nocardioides sp. B-3]|uniref:hypothetical protein n=1 Tax=Nocardioides sp. B-3 TaxID=2895565 RepID=UPI0021532A3C|nr:hypothetical protein [Nocardioides sp. B-3]UUZ61934.1 hypothetical protein LP418_06055 [Nocardioides sp. B-3]
MSDRPLERSGVIHDIGYRGYDGAREGTGALALSLYLTGVRHVRLRAARAARRCCPSSCSRSAHCPR